MSVTTLLSIMEQLEVLHDELAKLAHEKTSVLIENDVDRLNAITRAESKILKGVVELDKQRTHTIAEYLIARGFRPDPRITISELTKLVFKAEEKKALNQAQIRLLDKLQDLRKVNERNQLLIEHSLAYIEFSVDLLLDKPDQDLIYQNPNQLPPHSDHKRLFDTRA